MEKKRVWFTDVFKTVIQEHLIQTYALPQVPKNQYNNTEITNLIIFISLYGIYYITKGLEFSSSRAASQSNNEANSEVGSCWNNPP